jgi:hypothetical protein
MQFVSYIKNVVLALRQEGFGFFLFLLIVFVPALLVILLDITAKMIYNYVQMRREKNEI